MQCAGTTKQGVRCKIITTDGYCRYHRPQAAKLARPTPSFANPLTATKQGFIYIYTIESNHRNVHVFNHSRNRYEPLRQRGFLGRLFARFRSKPQMVLVKVGYTTLLPQTRLEQWRQQCGHPIHSLVPKARQVSHYDASREGWPTLAAHQTEQKIHQLLHAKYGRGKVECGGCKKDSLGIHTEWFLVPYSHLSEVFYIIDSSVLPP